MKNSKKISPSLMCAGLLDLKKYLDLFQEHKIELLHIDVMDGEFVPNFMLGTDYIKELRKITDIPLDVHLMVKKPEEKISWFDFRKGENVAVHVESTPHIQKALSEINKTGANAFVAINPGTPISALDYILDDIKGVTVMTVNPGFAGQKMIPQTLQKIRDVREYLDKKNYSHIEITVDGNVSFENARKMSEAGANIFVAGSSSIFHKDGTLEGNIQRFRDSIEVNG